MRAVGANLGRFSQSLKMGRSGEFQEGLRGKLAERNHCKLKRRGCNPDTVTADGKADRNFARLAEFSAKEL